jgi:anti-sigma factor RsiW
MINRDNFEMYCMLYADGELSPAEIGAFDSFLENNPDLLSEWKQWQQLKLEEDVTLFPDKAALLQTVSEPLSEEQAWLYIDGELSMADRTAREEWLRYDASGTQLIKELRCLVLEPTTVACPDKELLYQIPRQRRVIAMRWMASIAAAVLIAVVCWPLFTDKPLQPANNTKQVVKESIHPPSQTNAEKSTATSPITQPNISAKTGESLPISTQISAGEEAAKQDAIAANTPPVSATNKGNETTIASTETRVPPAVINQETPSNPITSLSVNNPANVEPELPNLAQPVVYRELNTESERETLTIGALELREGRFRGIMRKAEALLKRTGNRTIDNRDYKVVSVAQPL